MEQLHELSYDECRRVLVEGVVGRVALCTPSGPRIIPLNYAVVESAIVFRTTPYGLIGTYGRDVPMAFEVDTVNNSRRSGYSVVALGRGEFVEDPRLLISKDGERPAEPWANGARPLFVRLAWREISGRRVGDLDPAPEVAD